MTTMGSALKQVFDTLNINRMQTGIDMYGQGRVSVLLGAGRHRRDFGRRQVDDPGFGPDGAQLADAQLRTWLGVDAGTVSLGSAALCPRVADGRYAAHEPRRACSQ